MSFLMSLIKPLAYVSVPAFLLHTLSKNSPVVRYYVRLGVYCSAVGVCSVWGVLVSIGMTLLGRRFDINWVVARTFYMLTKTVLGLKLEVEGEEYLSKGPAVFLCNHQSMLDVAVMGRILQQQTVITAKRELMKVPLLGQFMTISGAIAIDRRNNVSAVHSLADAAQTMQTRRVSVFMFPEGTRTNKPTPDLLSFKKGAFHLAVQAGVPIIPIVCQNYWHLYHKGVFESGTLQIKVLPPIETTNLKDEDVRDLTNSVREQMLATLLALSGVEPEQAAPTRKEEVQSTAEEKQPATGEAAPLPAAEQQREPEVDAPVPEDAGSDAGSNSVPMSGSERGAETEEDEGMVLVDRPN